MIRLRRIEPPKQPSEIERVIAERGPAFEKDGILTFKGRGYGLVKVLIKHGKLSKKQPEHQITRSDVTYLPTVLRTYEPVEVQGKPGEARYQKIYRIQREGRTLNYVISRFTQKDDADHLVTIYVTRKNRQSNKISVRKKLAGPVPPSELSAPLEDTAGAASTHRSQGQPSQPGK